MHSPLCLLIIAQLMLGGFVAAHAAQSQPPTRSEVEHWLGIFRAGHETLSVEWKSGLILWLDKIPVPGDGEWHETVPTFAVRHRVTWESQSGTIRVEEQHNEGARWAYQLELTEGFGEVLKYEIAAGGKRGPLVRRYGREP